MYYVGWSSSTGEADWALRPLFASEAWPPKLFNTRTTRTTWSTATSPRRWLTVDEKEKAALYKTAQEQLYKDLPRLPWSRSRTCRRMPSACRACS
jgi:glutathione transport system substrate-binding protein